MISARALTLFACRNDRMFGATPKCERDGAPLHLNFSLPAIFWFEQHCDSYSSRMRISPSPAYPFGFSRLANHRGYLKKIR